MREPLTESQSSGPSEASMGTRMSRSVSIGRARRSAREGITSMIYLQSTRAAYASRCPVS